MEQLFNVSCWKFKRMTEADEAPWVPPILKLGTRGVRTKIWTFLYVNENRWFTAKEISRYLKMPLSTVQLALKDIRQYAPRIISDDKYKSGKGRPEKIYVFKRTFIK